MCKRFFRGTIFQILLLCLAMISHAQKKWPRIVNASDGSTVTIYEPQPEKLDNNILTGRAAVSLKKTASAEPVFGAIWFTANLQTNRDNRMAVLEKLNIKNVKMPGIEDTSKLKKLTTILETEAPKWKLEITLDEIMTSIEEEQNQTSAGLKNDAPKIIYTTKSSILVSIDGEPKLQQDEKLKMKKVMNTAFLIIQYPKDNQFYLYGGKYWYKSSGISAGWAYAEKLPVEIQQIDTQIKDSEKKNNATPVADSSAAKDSPAAIVICTEPTELIQSKGEANFGSIAGTDLLYVSNSDDDIFKNIADNKYYILLSGRWYSSLSLTGGWNYIDPTDLPAGFAKIPEGSVKDNVLSAVPGTDAARSAVMDAQIPQTAKVDRKDATCTVKYDGEPKFENITGTSLMLAMNTSSTVIKAGNTFYCVENGVWFKAVTPNGAWVVSDERPKDVDNIPASNPAYNIKYVYIYDVTPQYVYVGYTPGYMGCYVYGPVVVYGTGFYYSPWYGPYYYPRPITYGYSVHYNPWTGWSVGFHYSTGFFTFHYYVGGYHGGYWGAHHYHPPYYPHYHGGIYGRGSVHIHGNTNININQSNNIYRNQQGIQTSDIKRTGVQQKPSQQPVTKNNVMADKQGNLFRQDNNGSWQQKNQNGWGKPDNLNSTQLDKGVQNRERSQNLNNNFNQSNQGGNLGGKAKSSSGSRKR